MSIINEKRQRRNERKVKKACFFFPFLPLCVFIFLSLSLTVAAEPPWGKDADLSFPKCPPAPCEKQAPSTPIGLLGRWLITFHQEVISPADGPRSHYYPSSSQYTKEAIQKHGFIQGWLMGCDRLMRENGDRWVYPEIIGPEGNCLKSDPVK